MKRWWQKIALFKQNIDSVSPKDNLLLTAFLLTPPPNQTAKLPSVPPAQISQRSFLCLPPLNQTAKLPLSPPFPRGVRGGSKLGGDLKRGVRGESFLRGVRGGFNNERCKKRISCLSFLLVLGAMLPVEAQTSEEIQTPSVNSDGKEISIPANNDKIQTPSVINEQSVTDRNINNISTSSTTSIKKENSENIQISQSDSPELMLRDKSASPGENTETENNQTPTNSPNPIINIDDFFNVEEEPMEQINSVEQLSDIPTSGWAFEALQSLVEDYNCLSGFPDGTFKGDRLINRYEFAAALNRCLENIETLIKNDFALAQEDILKLQTLQQQFATELAVLRGRVDGLEASVNDLEATQFSTTTKLSGIVNFVATSIFSGSDNTQFVFQHRPRLTFSTSFSGRDLLITRIAGGNSTIPNVAGGTSEVVQANQWYGDFRNNFFIVTLFYLFPITNNFLGIVTPVGGLHADYGYPPINPYLEDFSGGTTTISAFAQRNQIYSLGGGSGLALVYNPSPTISVGAGYYGGQAFSSEEEKGLFDGNYSTGVNLKWQAANNLAFSLAYIHGYFPQGQFGFGDNSRAFGLPNYTGTAVANNTLAQFDTITNSYGAEFFWKVSSKFGIGAWVGYTEAEAIDVGEGEVWNYLLSFVFPDLGKEGNLGAILVGAQPYLGSLSGVPKFSNDTPLHVEAFYKYKLTDNISLTPGLIWNTAPNQDNENDDLLTGTMRMTFTF